MIYFRKMTEMNIGLFPVAIFIAIVLTLSIGGILHVREITKQTYFTELRAANDFEYVNIRQARKLK
ncbi:hypothetical protein A3H65_01850 [Candidatus Giovannonibacteria bacterium RIFCSPLOWO2_02_FULL_45_14]|uniref:Uncharacterized protein n=1 Tax=Candidatus Giovannonibacteria bacterium RIFCSPLOWO2_12_FULL_44_15 TaxID=1798364 RepID=A0A1F5XZK4_9BACT|nr:MAG: hypothetical protein A3C75_04005 [Candidatus Giovannonibacteria bacterium RIFCSPHIGHO2_02_FULL_44_31]OGF91195.1 MAG: hypothetical protein A3H65_01850 [Candidatus Giovannonibacteria bacterium RIFCSPLOWO2_02_FULL_45_14]OGF93354.1 MAG: hypothetical protein A3G54_00440 [Candidatus Giovannonibacteria bacterium RIFCSPLOWO2_12_FULL_44_15]